MKRIPNLLLVLLIVLFSQNNSASQWLDAYIPDFKVNDDILNSYQTNSSIGVDSAGNFVIVWDDVRNNPGEQSPVQIYCQRYSSNGSPIGNNFRIGQDTVGGVQICMMRDGKYVLTWGRIFREGIITKFDFYYQRFDKNGNALMNPSRIIDTSYFNGSTLTSLMKITCDTLGKFIITWAIKLNTSVNFRIYFQRFDSSGVKTGGIDSVSESFENALFPSVTMNRDGSFTISWDDERNPQTRPDIYMQRYNANGQKIGNNVRVSSDSSLGIRQAGNFISSDGKGRIVIAWTDDRNTENSIYYQLYDNSGNPVGVNRKANILSSMFSRAGSLVSMRTDGKFIIGWRDIEYSGGRQQYYGRRFDSLGNSISNPYMFPLNSPASTEQSPNSLFLLNDRVYSTWTHSIGSNINTDIYCNVRGFWNPDTVIGVINQSMEIKNFKLYSPYPNSFNPVTNIKYQAMKSDLINISVYDINGREIAELINSKQNEGTYEIKWNASSFTSGIYFIKLSTGLGYKSVKKALLIK